MKYSKPEMEIIKFDFQEVVRTSGVTVEGDNYGNNEGNQLPSYGADGEF